MSGTQPTTPQTNSPQPTTRLAPAPPLPFGVVASTGQTRPTLTSADLTRIAGDRSEVKARAEPKADLAVVPDVDAKDLNQAGWGIVFPANVDAQIKNALQPLIDYRRQQITAPGLFQVFEGDAGVMPGQSAVDWLDRHGVPLAIVDPQNGVPLYLLLVGSPQQISFEFQYILDLQWSVGRIYFDNPADYESYARAVVSYEKSSTLPYKKRVAMWMPQNGDPATTMLGNQVGQSFIAKGLGAARGYVQHSAFGDSATKQHLADILRGAVADGPPAMLFTGSHGLEWALTDPGGQRANQGALVTQEWSPGVAVTPGLRFAAEDVPQDAKVFGLITMMFACFGGGCPVTDTYETQANGSPLPLAPQALVARLPQRLLSQGALAVMAHVDRAWNWSFQSVSGRPQDQVLRSTIDAVLAGLPVGMALDVFNSQWSTLAAQLGLEQGQRAAGLSSLSDTELANLAVARDDSRNYTLLGDPAVRLRTEKMGS
jgi:hypothetical protein